MSHLPKLQLALDLTDLAQATIIAEATKDYVDIIEVGTILGISAGLEAVKAIRRKCPTNILLHDTRIIKAGAVLATNVFEAGADIVTIISDASQDTLEGVAKVSKEAGKSVLIEINKTYTDDDLTNWRQLGYDSIIYHRSSEVVDVEEEWNSQDFILIQKLYDRGFKVFVTGGLAVEDIDLFKDVPVYCFICGRSIWKSDNPKKSAKAYKERIEKVYG